MTSKLGALLSINLSASNRSASTATRQQPRPWSSKPRSTLTTTGPRGQETKRASLRQTQGDSRPALWARLEPTL